NYLRGGAAERCRGFRELFPDGGCQTVTAVAISGQPFLEQGTLGGVCCETQRAAHGQAGFGITTQVAEQLSPCRVKQVIVVEGVCQRLDVTQTGLRPVEVASGDGAVQLGDGRRREGQERVVQRDDLLPVGLCPAGRPGVARGNSGLQLVRPWPPQTGGPLQQGYPGGDPLPVPAGAILVLQQHQAACLIKPRLGAGEVETHQRKQ